MNQLVVCVVQVESEKQKAVLTLVGKPVDRSLPLVTSLEIWILRIPIINTKEAQTSCLAVCDRNSAFDF